MPPENEMGDSSTCCMAGCSAWARSLRPSDLGALEVGGGHHDRELVATHPVGPVAAAQRGGEEAAEAAERPIAGRVAPRVVDLLELVEVDEEQREGSLLSSDVLDQPVEVLVEGPMVAEPRELIAQRVGHGCLVSDLEVLLHRHEVRDRARHHQSGDHERHDGRGNQRRHGLEPGDIGRQAAREAEGGQRDQDADQHPAHQRHGAERTGRGGGNNPFHAGLRCDPGLCPLGTGLV